MKSLVLIDSRGKNFSPKEKILYFLVAAFFISLFLPGMPVINNIFTGTILLHSFFYNTLVEKKQLLRQRKAILLMLLFYLLHILSALVSVNRQEALVMLALRIPLLIFPLSLGLIFIREELKDRILFCYCVLVTIAAAACLCYALGQYAKFHDSGLLYDDSLTILLQRQSIYVALAVNLALFSYVYLLTRPSFTIRYPALAWLGIIFLLVFHFMLASRIALIVLYGSLLIFAVYAIVKKRRFREGALLAIGLPVCMALLLIVFPKTGKRFRELEYTNYAYDSRAAESHYNGTLTPEQWNGANIRLAVWSCGWELVRGHWLLGLPLGDKQDRLMRVYGDRQFEFALRTRRNMHDTYLDVLFTFGIIGLAIFLAGWLLFPLLGCRRDRDGLGPFIISAIAVAMITESYFDRSIGCLLAGFFICFVVSCQRPPGDGFPLPAHSSGAAID
jgi:O-antigen ligase